MAVFENDIISFEMTNFADWSEKFGDGLTPPSKLGFDAPRLNIKTCCWDSTKQAKRLHLQSRSTVSRSM